MAARTGDAAAGTVTLGKNPSKHPRTAPLEYERKRAKIQRAAGQPYVTRKGKKIEGKEEYVIMEERCI